jgi:thiamine biosynthesis lipoprotein
MATRFEILLYGSGEISLRAAGEEAIAEIERLEDQLSLYRPSSEIAQVNAQAPHKPVRVSPPVFALLQQAKSLHAETAGAFDITIAPLVRCWGFMGAAGRSPTPEEVSRARECVGMDWVILDPNKRTVQFAREGVMLDLGAIGKGYAIECAAEILRETGVSSALLHGGTSTVFALGHPPDAELWKVALEPFPDSLNADRISMPTVSLRDEAVSVSAIWGRSFTQQGKIVGHVLDPRIGQPVANAFLAAVVLPSATETDALSTALLVLGQEGHQTLARLRPAMRTLLAVNIGGKPSLQTTGFRK